MQHGSAHNLYIKMPHIDRALGCLAHHSKSFWQKVIKWLALSNAVSEFIINRVESGHAAAAGEDLATYRTRVYGDAGGVVSLIEQGKPGAVSHG